MSRKMPSKMANKSKNGSIWAIDPDDEEDDLSEQGQHKEKTKLKSYIEISLNSAFKKDPVFTEVVIRQARCAFLRLSKKLNRSVPTPMSWSASWLLKRRYTSFKRMQTSSF